MEQAEETKLLIKIAQMYYEQDMTQSQISKELGIYRTTISRMLKNAREKGIVNITINYDADQTYSLEEKLKQLFKLKKVIVVPGGAEQPEHVRLKNMGQACADFFSKIVESHDVIGFSWGSGLAAVVEEMMVVNKRDVICVPLVGGPSGKLESKYHVNTICYTAALKLQAQSYLIDVPAIVERKETRNDILESNYFKEISDMWNRITIAVFGIGSPQITGRATWSAFYGNEVIEELEQGKVVGDICSNFFDSSGKQVKTGISDRTITIPLDLLKQTRYSIGIAESIEKVSGLLGALRGGYMNVLVTIEETAKHLIELCEG